MNTIIKSALVAYVLFIAVSFTLLAEADTFVFNGQRASVSTAVYSENLFLTLGAYEDAYKSKSSKINSNGAYVFGFYDDEENYYYFFGDAFGIEFNATKTGNLPDKVKTSGSIPVTGEKCDASDSSCTPFSDTVIFIIDAEALSDQSMSSKGNSHSDDGIVKLNFTWNNEFIPASFNGSSITSSFGTETPSEVTIGQSRGNSVQITK